MKHPQSISGSQIASTTNPSLERLLQKLNRARHDSLKHSLLLLASLEWHIFQHLEDLSQGRNEFMNIGHPPHKFLQLLQNRGRFYSLNLLSSGRTEVKPFLCTVNSSNFSEETLRASFREFLSLYCLKLLKTLLKSSTWLWTTLDFIAMPSNL